MAEQPTDQPVKTVDLNGYTFDASLVNEIEKRAAKQGAKWGRIIGFAIVGASLTVQAARLVVMLESDSWFAAQVSSSFRVAMLCFGFVFGLMYWGWIAGAIGSGILVWRVRRKLKRARQCRCIVCNYSLIATPNRCPECGTSNAETMAALAAN